MESGAAYWGVAGRGRLAITLDFCERRGRYPSAVAPPATPWARIAAGWDAVALMPPVRRATRVLGWRDALAPCCLESSSLALWVEYGGAGGG